MERIRREKKEMGKRDGDENKRKSFSEKAKENKIEIPKKNTRLETWVFF